MVDDDLASAQLAVAILEHVNEFYLVTNPAKQERYTRLGFDTNTIEEIDTLREKIRKVVYAIRKGQNLDGSDREPHQFIGFPELNQHRLGRLTSLLSNSTNPILKGSEAKGMSPCHQKLNTLRRASWHLVEIAKRCEEVCPLRFQKILCDIGEEVFAPLVQCVDTIGMSSKPPPAYADEYSPPTYSVYDPSSSLMSYCQSSFEAGQRYLQDMANSLWELTMGPSDNVPQPAPPSQEPRYDMHTRADRPSSIYSAISSAVSTILSNLSWWSCSSASSPGDATDLPPDYNSGFGDNPSGHISSVYSRSPKEGSFRYA